MSNQFSRFVSKINSAPVFMRSFLLTKLFSTHVKFAGTTGIKLESVDNRRTRLILKNKKKVQNHIGGIHAIAAGVLAESATGIAFGMNVPDNKIPLLKSLTINYKRRMQGDLAANATMTAEQIKEVETQDKGDMLIPVSIKDESGEEPVECFMQWAWVTKRQS
jgi:acyl-coenzyme A thioesterase PaaI-like protein